MIRQFELVEMVKSYDPDADEDALNRAYVFAMKAHGSQKRASGDPYFSHPLEVAGILTSYHLDSGSIITALLHDTIEDTPATIEEVENLFGHEIARLVDGVTKLTRIEFQSDQEKQAENFRKLVLAMSEDIRVLLVKLADRVHNMRTLHHIKSEEKRRRIAMETMDIYAPLAERIGIQELKAELEDTAFAELNPDGRRSVTKRLNFLREQDGDLVPGILTELTETLAKEGVPADVSGREKTAYSIWRKMQQKNVSFEQLSDIMAFRIVVKDLDDCYRALGIIHRAYRVVPGRFKDFISTPKPNGYCSIHTGILGPHRHRIEIQIRTTEMHEVAERGVAAHWQYKQGYGKTEGKEYHWLRQLLEILESTAGPEEFLEHTKLEMFQDQVFCFTPRGDLINLPQGGTPVDFAYAVHSEVGDTCVGAKINGRMMPLRTQLRNGDQVEVLTSKAQTPSPTWERFVATGKARAHIRRFIRLQEREEYEKLGKSILGKTFRDDGFEVSEKGLIGILKRFKMPSVSELVSQVGSGNLSARDLLEAVYPAAKRKTAQDGDNVIPMNSGSKGHSVPIKGLIPGMAMHFNECCHPLPGDRIVGIMVAGKGIDIHTIDCDSLLEYQETADEWLDLAWDTDTTTEAHIARIDLTVMNEPGTLGELANVIARHDGNITNLKITSRSVDFFDMQMDIEVHNVKHLTEIIAALRASTPVNTVDRGRG
ncbi:MAG: bifunctional (p)ppGpp synthetase/guanosine-3',5'-bis(diphosphate) 3'-pyrophosphohydrolase [Rhodospirillales bacterium]|jgi:GTP diphosphokinase / guanosine-3',5'-bis(diphosphate) 3'-diphosphatase|nr:bifunctional (p)ppGpp synthetase/guanosine-3',5'-bis(diphosphate) 3'-pyrophosphohydrolase [Rhodospirillales bacterium]MBT4041677.1 bifunctional (p)ppGpp synthetase/guanosine-3',5'-bis(diphosphate) 3'-pyrophosphohydrolase [Rhodospirillales bacterium]MBT4626381.1 bifunctional (p)ppGpp synthetase/guanosine-3',5'-bis(diphosphate) 3'-pyrophosphohydrolase [Rhodospirillales bacterium]MBT5350131.1 bifunctional (p)ppGpp synthetase/guanosine-3',5'-bis(diphosphate) 3'-pyrophosphohydrolase [Rhodospirilla